MEVADSLDKGPGYVQRIEKTFPTLFIFCYKFQKRNCSP